MLAQGPLQPRYAALLRSLGSVMKVAMSFELPMAMKNASKSIRTDGHR